MKKSMISNCLQSNRNIVIIQHYHINNYNSKIINMLIVEESLIKQRVVILKAMSKFKIISKLKILKIAFI